MCPHDPRETIGPIGMYHCPECGEMVLAGMDHIDWSLTKNEPMDEQDGTVSHKNDCKD